jgi:hypothetical protein
MMQVDRSPDRTHPPQGERGWSLRGWSLRGWSLRGWSLS